MFLTFEFHQDTQTELPEAILKLTWTSHLQAQCIRNYGALGEFQEKGNSVVSIFKTNEAGMNLILLYVKSHMVTSQQ